MPSAEPPPDAEVPLDADLPPAPPDPTVHDEDGAPRSGGWRRSPGLRRTALAVGLVVAVVVFARAARSEVRYETDPSGAEPVGSEQADELARSSAGTRCGDWPAALSTTAPPEVKPLHTALWADVGAFHVQSAHFFVRAVRFDVEGGTASAPGLEPSGSLTVPLAAGATADVTVSCGATAMTVHLLGGDGRDVGDALLDIGTRRGTQAPVLLTKGGGAPTSRSAECVELAAAAQAMTGATTDGERIAAGLRLIEVARAEVSSAADQLTDDERADADAVIAMLGTRLAELQAGSPDARRPATDDDLTAMAGVARAFDRLCG